MNERSKDTACALALAALTVLVVGFSAQTLGFTRDEGYYFKAGELYWGWFKELASSMRALDPLRPFSQTVIDKHWSYNHEHPVLLKTLFALSYGAREQLGLAVSVHDALRFPAWLVAGLSTALVFALGRTLLPRRAAVVAALLWLSMPHVFWHMHVACFDVGAAAGHTALVLAYWRWRHTLAGALAVGVVFGLAAAVKHNVLPVPALLLAHWWLTQGRAPAGDARRGLTLPAIPVVFLSLAIVSPLVFFAHWPWLWPAPLTRWGSYIGYHLQHEHYPILYFKDLLTAPPFPMSFPFVMSAVTIPVPTLVAMLLGLSLAIAVIARSLLVRNASARQEQELTMVPLGDVAHAPSWSPALLLAVNALYPFVLIALPSTPIFGGTKHWMNALPFACVLAAWAIEEAMARTLPASSTRAHAADARVHGARVWRRVAPAWLLIAAIALPGVVISARVWPYGLGAYNELIGFTRGAANVGMQRTFWGYELRAALPIVNAHQPPVKRMHFGDTNNDSWRMYQRDDLLRDDIGFSNGVRGADVASVQPQGEFKQQWMDVLNEWSNATPDKVLHAQGVPVSVITFREGRARAADP